MDKRQTDELIDELPTMARPRMAEVDGKQHYAGADSKAEPNKYGAMAATDRDLRLSG